MNYNNNLFNNEYDVPRAGSSKYEPKEEATAAAADDHNKSGPSNDDGSEDEDGYKRPQWQH